MTRMQKENKDPPPHLRPSFALGNLWAPDIASVIDTRCREVSTFARVETSTIEGVRPFRNENANGCAVTFARPEASQKATKTLVIHSQHPMEKCGWTSHRRREGSNQHYSATNFMLLSWRMRQRHSATVRFCLAKRSEAKEPYITKPYGRGYPKENRHSVTRMRKIWSSMVVAGVGLARQHVKAIARWHV